MFKNEQKTQGKTIPRYTQEDESRLVALAQDDLVKPGIRFRDIYERRIRSTMLPIEEGVLKNCFYKRMVLLGDSWHKVGNQYWSWEEAMHTNYYLRLIP